MEFYDTMEYYLAIKKDEILLFDNMEETGAVLMLSRVNQAQNDKYHRVKSEGSWFCRS